MLRNIKGEILSSMFVQEKTTKQKQQKHCSIQAFKACVIMIFNSTGLNIFFQAWLQMYFMFHLKDIGSCIKCTLVLIILFQYPTTC